MKNITLFLSFLITTWSFSQDHMVRGFVYDNKTGEPVAFEKVLLIPTVKGQNVLGSSTGVDGNYSIAKVPKGTYLMKVESFEYKLFEKEITITQSNGISDVRIDLLEPDAKSLETVVISSATKQKTTEVIPCCAPAAE